MCDYSLGGLPNRLAAEGDDLIVYRFPTYSVGLAPAGPQQTKSSNSPHLWRRIQAFLTLPRFRPGIHAVCVPPGASLILKGIPCDLQRKWDVGEEETVLFTQISAEFKTHRDAICFRNGRQVSLQHLREGLLIKVVSLGSDPAGDQEPKVVEVVEGFDALVRNGA
jgi:hypothetical protein